jgi:hypothetical protein
MRFRSEAIMAPDVVAVASGIMAAGMAEVMSVPAWVCPAAAVVPTLEST